MLLAAVSFAVSFAAAGGERLLVSLPEPSVNPRQLDAREAAVRAAQERAIACAPGVTVRIRYRTLALLSVVATEAQARQLRGCDAVVGVATPRLFYPSLSESLPLIGAVVARTESGFDGTGGVIAIIDTGVDVAAADLGGCVGAGCRVVYANDVADGDSDADDCHGHGSNVAAIAAGSSGVAPGANLLIEKVFPDAACSSGADEEVIALGIDDVVVQASTYNIVAMNMSLGAGHGYNTRCDGGGYALTTAVEAAYNAGILVSVAAGNDGDDTGVSYPACLSKVLAVANSYDTTGITGYWCTTVDCSTTCNDGSSIADQLVCASNGGRLVALAAPGAMTTAGGQTMGGTSQSAPHVAGAIALLREAAPSTNLSDLSDWIVRSNVNVADNRGTAKSYPRLDVVAVLAGDVVDLSAYDAIAEDDADGDGLAESGEGTAMLVSVENHGPGEHGPYRMLVATSDPEITVTKASGTMSRVGRMAITTAHGFLLDVSPTCVTDHDAEFTATIYDDVGNPMDSTFSLFIRCETDDDLDGFPWSTDCDETRADVNPAASEVCNDIDDNCDGVVDTDAIDAPTWYADADVDGFGDAAVAVVACVAADGTIAEGTDCDDTSALISPSAEEACNAADDNCDGVVDEGDVCVVDEGPSGKKSASDAGCGCGTGKPAGGGVLLLVASVAARFRRRIPESA